MRSWKLTSPAMILVPALIALALAPAARADARPTEQVAFPGADGFELAATIYRPAGPTPTAGFPAVLLFHMLGKDRSTYESLAERLRAGGMLALAVDLRGHGGSMRQHGVERRQKQFGPADWLGMPRDVIAAATFARRLPGVDGARLALVGASIGANAAYIAAAEDSRIRALVLLSPGEDYRGLALEGGRAGYGKRPLFAASGGDEDAYSRTALDEIKARRADAETVVVPGGGHGTDLLSAVADRVVRFLQSQLSGGK